ncbi:MAG: portal protein, partial [Rhizomicrobium sp.]
AKLSEILLPAGEKAFSFNPTPDPDLIKALEDGSQVVHDGMGNTPLTRPLQPGEAPPAAPPAPTPVAAPTAAPIAAPTAPSALGVPSAPVPSVPGATPASAPRVPLTVKDLAREKIEEARQKAKDAETRVYDWMVESQYTAECRKVIFDASRIGVGVLKGPFPKPTKSLAIQRLKSGLALQMEDKIIPACQWVDPWNIFPDPACGENIHEGEYIFERDYLSESQVRKLRQMPGYIGDQLDKVIEQGPDTGRKDDNTSGDAHARAQRKGRYEVWYFYGTLKRDELDILMSAGGRRLRKTDVPPDQKQVYAIVTLINSVAVRATLNPLDSGRFPYHSMPWQRRAGHWAGIGVAEQARTPQRIVNAATRAVLNNAGKSAGSQIVLDQSIIEPADGSWIIVPDKIWRKKGDSPLTVDQAFKIFEIPNVTQELMQIVEYGMNMAEESTSIPLVTQGQTGPTTPETLGATQLQDSNANQLLRSIGYAFDDFITEPVARLYYEWLLLDPDVPDDEKGDFNIDAHGSVALVERAIADQTIAAMGQMAGNPVYGIDPKKWAKQFLKSKRLDPEDFTYSPEDQQKMEQNPVPPVPVQVQQLKNDALLKTAVMKQTAETQSIQSEEKIAAAANALEGQRHQVEQSRTQVQATVNLHEIQTRRELAMLEYAARHQMSLDQVKGELAKTAMTLQTQKELNAADNMADLAQHRAAEHPERPHVGMKPPEQVPGRAGNGHAFDQSPA